MPSLICPSCRHTLDLPGDTRFCPRCGADLQSALKQAPPAIPPTAPTGFSPADRIGRAGIDYRLLASRQRWLLWLVLVAIVSQFFFFVPMGRYGLPAIAALGLVRIAVYLLMVVGVVRILLTLRGGVIVTIICGFLMLAPCLNLLVLLVVNQRVTRKLKDAGLHVGLFGVPDEEVERVMNPALCKGCGYNLTGNVSGTCPECGRPIGPARA